MCQQHGSLVNVSYDVPRDREGTHTIEIREFISATREGKPLSVPPEEVYCVQLIMDAMYKSSETKDEVKIDYTKPSVAQQ